jgi:hypothetical protein
MYSCTKGHNSTEADFCSECGAKITAAGIAELVSNPTNKSAPVQTESINSQSCPDCSTLHESDSGNFCEICGYNFLTNTKGGDPLSNFPPPFKSPVNSTTAPTQLPTKTDSVPLAADTTLGQWRIVMTIDPSLATPDSPSPPPNQAPVTINLKQGANLIGRTSQARAIHPEIPLDLDDAVSSRHGILTLQSDGSLVLRDIGSSNGTMVNGKEIAVMADIPIASGDQITLGHWTRLQIKSF